jgi:hypothetical protein
LGDACDERARREVSTRVVATVEDVANPRRSMSTYLGDPPLELADRNYVKPGGLQRGKKSIHAFGGVALRDYGCPSCFRSRPTIVGSGGLTYLLALFPRESTFACQDFFRTFADYVETWILHQTI